MRRAGERLKSDIAIITIALIGLIIIFVWVAVSMELIHIGVIAEASP